MSRGAQVVEDIKKSTGNSKVVVMELDLTSLKSVRTFVDEFRARKLPINILICKFTQVAGALIDCIPIYYTRR